MWDALPNDCLVQSHTVKGTNELVALGDTFLNLSLVKGFMYSKSCLFYNQALRDDSIEEHVGCDVLNSCCGCNSRWLNMVMMIIGYDDFSLLLLLLFLLTVFDEVFPTGVIVSQSSDGGKHLMTTEALFNELTN